MEIYPAEGENIKKLIQEWILHPEHELECTFGKGSVDASTFFQVAQRLRSKGLTELPQEDRLTISTPEHVRFTIQSMGVIQQYCRDDTLNGKPFIAMIKDRASNEMNTNVDLNDYDVRIKTRREIPISNDESQIKDLFGNWPKQRKAFRMIRRWSFEEKGLHYDLSIVRSTSRTSKGEFKWQIKFLDQDLSVSPYLYEIEVELIRIEGDTVESAQKRLIKGVGEVLRGIQKNSILIRKSKKEKVIESYKSFIQNVGFLGCNPVTLEQINFTDPPDDDIPNIRSGYNVTDKADGLRCLGYCDTKGEFYLIDMALNVYRTGLKSIHHRLSIIDGEWVTKTSKHEPISQFLAFDIYYTTDKKDVSQYPFYNKENESQSRHTELKEWIEKFNKGEGPEKIYSQLNTLQISMKKYLFAKGNDIFKQAEKVLDTYRIYYTDGLIFTPNKLPLPGYNEEKKLIEPGQTFKSQFKWKPSEDNTIDFYVRFEKTPDNPKLDRITIGIKPETNETIRYKTIRLYVGSARSKAFNPRDILLNERKLDDYRSGGKDYRPIPFYPKQYYDSMASISYGKVILDPSTQEEYVSTEFNNEPIQDKSIIEMRYDPSQPRGWRWIPLRIRHDKTERLQRGILARTLNSETVADSVWNSIHDPITESMIRSGSTQASDSEVNKTLTKIEERDNVTMKYFERKAPTEDVLYVRGLREYHNHYIKEVVLYSSVLKQRNKVLLDIACGTGSDIRRWSNRHVKFVLGIDYSGDNITNIDIGAYSQYANFKQKNMGKEVPPMVFVIGDSSKRIMDGSAGSTDEERDILRSVFGKYNPIGPIPPYIDHIAASELFSGADAISCMFALHYFFKTKESLDGVLRNIRECLKVGGYFFGCCFDGDSVFNFLRNTPSGGTITGLEKESIIWNIRKEYDSDEFPNSDESLGMKVNIDFISIGKPHDEYLVSFPYFVKRMNENGCELLNESELKEIGLKNSTNLFSESYEMSKQNGRIYSMSDSVKKFSFLNRWFIFRKKREISVEDVNEEYIPLVNKEKPQQQEPQQQEPQQQEPQQQEESEKQPFIEKESDVKQFTVEPVGKVEPRDNVESNDKPLERTIPVISNIGAPKGSIKQYASNEVFNFYIGAALDDKILKIGDKGAARYLSPATPFKIEDIDDKAIVYPSLEHFMAGMMYKYGTDRPQYAITIFSREGTIHQKYLRIRTVETEGMKKAITEVRDHELIKEEIEELKLTIRPAAFRKNKAILNEGVWASKKDELLRYAVEQRYKKDERLRKIIEAARKNHKYLLYYTHGSSVNLGGMRKSDGTITGDNKLGKLYMELGGYTEY